MLRKFAAACTAGLLAVSVVACGDSTGPGDQAQFNVRFAADMSGALASAADGDAAAAVLSVASVDSINVTLTGVDAISSAGGESYVSLPLSATATSGRINLLALPTDLGGTTTGILLSQGSVPAGTYTGVRLRYDVATASITLNQQVTVGQHTFAPGTYTLDVPSGAQTGIKVPFGTLTLGSDATADVVLTFDAGATIQNVIATGSGKLMISPVLHVRTDVEEE
jgi:hypothetical protein